MSCKTTLNAIPTNPIIFPGRRRKITGSYSIKTHSPNPFSPLHSLHYNYKIHHLGHVQNQEVRKTRRSFSTCVCSLELPLLPFPLEQVLVPSETKTLHLFEARYIGLLEESFYKKKGLFVHFVLEPIVISSTSGEANYAARYGCLVAIEKVEQLHVGALVSIRGVGRVSLVKFEQADPYLKGIVIPLQDNVPEDESKISSQLSELTQALYSLNSLEIKLKDAKEAALQTQTINSLLWAEKELSLDCDKAFIPSHAERVSFAAFQTVTGSSDSEMLKLQKEKLDAMDLKDTPERLEKSLEFVKNNISMVAAKLAIQSLELR